jgi:mannose-6-phosphate isomerase-like protein (cupin superfamily)
VVGHHHAVPFFLTADMFGGLDFEVAGGDISQRVDQPVAQSHSHTVAEIYLLLSPTAGGAAIDVFCDGETQRVESPAAVYVPAGATHHFVTRKAEPGSTCLGILLGVDGEPPA